MPRVPPQVSVGLQPMQTVPSEEQQHVRPSAISLAVRHENGDSVHALPVVQRSPAAGGDRSVPTLHPELEDELDELLAAPVSAAIGEHCWQSEPHTSEAALAVG